MLRWEPVIVTQTARRVLRQEHIEFLLRVGQELEGVDDVSEVDLHLVVLASHENELICLEFRGHELTLLGKTHHKAQSNFLVIVGGLVPEKMA